VYMMLISGKVEINRLKAEPRDAIGIWNTDSFEIEASEDAEILLIEVPMVF